MLFKFFKQIFSKSSKKESSSLLSLPKFGDLPESLHIYIDDVVNLLQIKKITLSTCACMFQDTNTHETSIYPYFLPKIDTIADNTETIAGYVDGDSGMIYIARYIRWAKDNKKPSFELLSEAELLLNTLHELRHLWQAENIPEEYYATTAYGLEHQHDSTEIDADAFAYAYIFSDKTPYSWNDMPLQKMNHIINTVISKDYAAYREQRARELATEYNFKNYLWIPPRR